MSSTTSRKLRKMSSEKYRIFTIEPSPTKAAHTTLNFKIKRYTDKRVKDIGIEKLRQEVPQPINDEWRGTDLKTRNSHKCCWSMFFVFLVLSFSVLLSCPTILIPQHDGIKNPEYWFELMINVNLTFNISWVLAALYDVTTLLKLNSLACFWSTSKLYLSGVLAFDIPYCFMYSVWTSGYEFNYPIPFSNLLVYISSFVFLISLWFRFPRKMRKNKEIRNKIIAYIISYLWSMIIAFQKQCLRLMFTRIPLKFQWIMAIVLPIYRKFNMYMMNSIVDKWITFDKLVARCYVNIYINCNYALFIAISVGSTSLMSTSYSILTFELFLNLYTCFKIIRLQRKIGQSGLQKREELRIHNLEAIQNLALTEILEILVPVAYTMTLVIAYYGPNNDVLGNIRNGYWQYHAVDDISTVLRAVFQMFCLDLASAIIGGILLWKFSSINLLEEFFKIWKRYWPLVALRIAQITSKVNNSSF